METALTHYMRFDELETYLLGTDADVRQHASKGTQHRVLSGVMALRCGVSLVSITRWRATNEIPWRTADEIAVRLNVHPVNIWPEFHHEEMLCPT